MPKIGVYLEIHQHDLTKTLTKEYVVIMTKGNERMTIKWLQLKLIKLFN